MWAGTVCNAGLKDKQSEEREISCSLQLLECPCMYSEWLAKEDSCYINTKAAFGNLVIILQETSKSGDHKLMFSWCWSAFCVLVQNYMGSAFLEHCGSGSYWFLAFPQWFLNLARMQEISSVPEGFGACIPHLVSECSSPNCGIQRLSFVCPSWTCAGVESRHRT